jgi:uncharacterized protein YkwD
MKTLALALLLLLQGPRPDVRPASLEKKVFELVNSERVKKKLPILIWDDRLAAVARSHSEDMGKREYMAHVSPDGKSPVDRVKAKGIDYTFVSENLFQNNLYDRTLRTGARIIYYWNTEDEIASTSVAGWMNSPGHRANILSAKPVTSGIGVAIAAEKVYITQLFHKD